MNKPLTNSDLMKDFAAHFAGLKANTVDINVNILLQDKKYEELQKSFEVACGHLVGLAAIMQVLRLREHYKENNAPFSDMSAKQIAGDPGELA